MDADPGSWSIDFAKPLPLFPLGGVTLLPHTVAPLHIFEPRYVQMVSRALDSDGLIAMAVLTRDVPTVSFGEPAIYPATCVGRIAQHHRMSDGRFNILLQGLCRATIADHLPAGGDTWYRRAHMRPVLNPEPQSDSLETARAALLDMFRTDPLRELCAAESVAGALQAEDAPTETLLELIAMSVIADEDARYQLLAEGDPARRAEIELEALADLRRVLTRARPQREMHIDQPRGVWLN